MAALVLALFLAAQAAPTTEASEVDALLVQLQRHGWLAGSVPTEQAVVRSLNELVLDEPDRVVCVQRAPTGSRHKRNYCTTLRRWYDLNTDRNVSGRIAMAEVAPLRSAFVNQARPSHELVDMVTQRYRDPKVRERINIRAATKLQSTSPAEPPISNP